jgi:hypothetical protein
MTSEKHTTYATEGSTHDPEKEIPDINLFRPEMTG